MMVDNVCEEFCSECWEELSMCSCRNREFTYSEFDCLFEDHAELDSEPGALPANPLLGDEPVKTKGRKVKPNVH